MARGAVRHEFGGYEYRSKFECSLAKQLTDAEIPFDYEPIELEYFLKVPNTFCEECGSKACYQDKWYTPDFYLNRQDIFIEAKGMFTAENRKKALAVREGHPDLDIRFVFMANNKLHKKSEIRYSDWCDKYGFEYAFKTIPDGWLDNEQRIRED